MKRLIKYGLFLLVIVLVAYKSVYFKKLSDLKKEGVKFDAAAYSKKIWEEQLPAKLDTAISLSHLLAAIQTDPEKAFARYSNALGIGNYRYCLVKLAGTAATINEDDITIGVSHADSVIKVRLATEYVYGNAIRDASGLVDIKDFTNTTDLNNISEELNRTVRTNIIPAFKKQVRKGDKLEVTGAVEINKEHIRLNDLEVIPVRLKIIQ